MPGRGPKPPPTPTRHPPTRPHPTTPCRLALLRPFAQLQRTGSCLRATCSRHFCPWYAETSTRRSQKRWVGGPVGEPLSFPGSNGGDGKHSHRFLHPCYRKPKPGSRPCRLWCPCWTKRASSPRFSPWLCQRGMWRRASTHACCVPRYWAS